MVHISTTMILIAVGICVLLSIVIFVIFSAKTPTGLNGRFCKTVAGQGSIVVDLKGNSAIFTIPGIGSAVCTLISGSDKEKIYFNAISSDHWTKFTLHDDGQVSMQNMEPISSAKTLAPSAVTAQQLAPVSSIGTPTNYIINRC